MARISEARILYTPRLDATPEAELNALSAVYALALQRYRNSKEGGPPTAPTNAKERIKDDFRATPKYTRSP
jgi:hypothetical protein